MRQLLIFIKKEIRHILRDPRTLLLLMGMPVVQLILFGFAISTEIRDSRFVVYDPSHDKVSQAIVQKLDASGYFSFREMVADPSQIVPSIVKSKAPFAVVFPENLEERLARGESPKIQIVADGADPNTAAQIVQYASQIIGSYTEQTGVPSLMVVPSVRLLYNPSMKGAYNFVPGVLGMILMLICAMMTSIAIVREKERGTMELLLVSPMPPLMVLLAKIIPYFLLSLVNFIIVLITAVYVIGVPIAGSLTALFVCAFLFMLSALALGTFISTKTDSQAAAMLISGMVFMLPVVLLSGMMFPIANMPAILQGLSCIIPARWFISAARTIMIQGAGFEGVIREMIILAVMSVLFTIAALKSFKVRLE